MRFNKTRAERIVRAAMAILPYDLGNDLREDSGITLRAEPDTVEALKQSDSPFAGYVISCLISDPAEAKAQYDDWANRSVQQSMADLDKPGAVTYSMDEVSRRLDERMSGHRALMTKLQKNFTAEEIERLGVIVHEEV